MPDDRPASLASDPPRPVTAGDLPGVLALIGAVYAEYGQTLRAELEEPHLLDPDWYFRRNGGEFWVVSANGHLVATAAVKLHADVGELKSLYVRADARGAGLGRRLTELAMTHTRRSGRTRFVLWSDTRFHAAHALYRALGFRQTGIRDLRDSNASWEFRFERVL